MPSRIATIACAAIVASHAIVLTKEIGKPDGWLINDQGKPVLTDYIALWGAGRLALEGRYADVYDWNAHAEAMAQGLGTKPNPFPFPYPPPFLAVLAPLAKIPYIPSMLLWVSLTLLLYAAVCARIIGRWQGAVWMCAPFVTLSNFYVGQNGFLTAALLGGGLLALPKRPVLAGVLIGALSIKPHLGLLIPLALAAAGCWTAFMSAAATVIAIVLASLLAFGLEPWLAFFANLANFGATVASDKYDVPFKLQSIYGFLHTLGMPRPAALGFQVALSLGLAGAVIAVWRSKVAFDLKAALLSTAVVLASPYVFIYDLLMLCIAQAFLLRHWLATRLEMMDVIMLVAVNTMSVLFVKAKIPAGFLSSAMTMILVARLIWPQLRQQWGDQGGFVWRPTRSWWGLRPAG